MSAISQRIVEKMAAEAYVEARRRLAVDTASDVKRLARYAKDPFGFVHDVFEWGDEAPTPYQDEILERFYEARRFAVRGPHGLGKTALAAWLVWWGILTADDVKVLTTASAWRQLTKFLWPEIHKWGSRIRWNLAGRPPLDQRSEMLTLSVKLGPTREAFAVASDNSDLVEGAHAKRIVYIYDEAKAIPNATFDATEGAFSTADINEDYEAFALAISTPGDSAGRFFEICSNLPGYEDWQTRHVTLDEAIAAGRISERWAEQRRRQWGEESPVYQARVLGNFPTMAEDALISMAWIERARENHLDINEEWPPPVQGVDIARFGDDDSARFERRGPVVLKGEIWHGHDTMKSAGRIKARKYRAQIDVIGMGAGVVDRLKEQKFPAVGINVGEAARNSEDFRNLRAELYWNLRERFKDGDVDLSRLPAPLYERLMGELVSIKYSYTSKGQIQIEPKKDMKKRLARSPDVADALMLTFAGKQYAELPKQPEQESKFLEERVTEGKSKWKRY